MQSTDLTYTSDTFQFDFRRYVMTSVPDGSREKRANFDRPIQTQVNFSGTQINASTLISANDSVSSNQNTHSSQANT